MKINQGPRRDMGMMMVVMIRRQSYNSAPSKDQKADQIHEVGSGQTRKIRWRIFIVATSSHLVVVDKFNIVNGGSREVSTEISSELNSEVIVQSIGDTKAKSTTSSVEASLDDSVSVNSVGGRNCQIGERQLARNKLELGTKGTGLTQAVESRQADRNISLLVSCNVQHKIAVRSIQTKLSLNFGGSSSVTKSVHNTSTKGVFALDENRGSIKSWGSSLKGEVELEVGVQVLGRIIEPWIQSEY